MMPRIFFLLLALCIGFITFGLGKRKLENAYEKSAFFTLVNGHNSTTVKVTPFKFELDLCFVVKSNVKRFITLG